MKTLFAQSGLWFAGRALAALAGAALLGYSLLTTTPSPESRNEAAPTVTSTTSTSTPTTSKTKPPKPSTSTKPSTSKKPPVAPSTTEQPRPMDEEQQQPAGDAGDTGGADETVCADNDPECTGATTSDR
ncbi:hypothetical protein [Lentzea aerocolonigenes]|uniref:hypothetical protein n=1 Tax=Lentzea aerocolonigenes TaxID=68170 RepID=UPI0012DF0410|nr:hypothetical protein [Lentzea aerocolonigenes]